jgi:hypothetical protein
MPIAQKQSIAFGLAEMAIEIRRYPPVGVGCGWLLDQARRSEAYLATGGDLAMVTDRRQHWRSRVHPEHP